MARTNPAGDDVFDMLRELFEFHPDDSTTVEILRAIHRAADNRQDGAPDAGAVAHACTRIAGLAGDMLRDLEASVLHAVGRLILRRTREGWHLDYTDTDQAVRVAQLSGGRPRLPLQAFGPTADPEVVARSIALGDGCILSIELEPLS